MQIQVNHDHNVEGREGLTLHVEEVVHMAIEHLSAHVSRVIVHLTDENGDKAGAFDKRCMMEARLEGRPPLAVTEHASNMHTAIGSAATKLKTALEHVIDRMRAKH